jgi:hypothetical protein
MTAQNKMMTLSTNSAQQIVAGATHSDMVLEDKYAAVTAQAILAVVDSVRNHRPLSQWRPPRQDSGGASMTRAFGSMTLSLCPLERPKGVRSRLARSNSVRAGPTPIAARKPA